MNYYIQGNKEKADKIKAAFNGKGIYSNCNFANENYLYYQCDGKVAFCFIGGGLANIIKTHPDYKELELPVEPKFKFKVEDWIVQNDNGTVSQITKTINAKDEFGEYRAYEHTNGYFAACFENEYHIWTIQDAKDGDVITNGKMIVIFNKLEEPAYRQHIVAYAGLDLCGRLQITKDTWQLGVDRVIPATKEQRDLLFAKMKEAGYEWDAEKKELHKIIKPHYDIANFNPFDKVLVRDNDRGKWRASIFSYHIKGRQTRYPFCCIGNSFSQCIPYEGNEHLFGTTDMPSEEFINW